MAIERLDAWGHIERLKANGGLALASKSGDGGGSSALGEPSMGTAFFKAADVDATLLAWRTCRRLVMDRLIRFMYIDGSQEVLISTDFLLLGGDKVHMTAQQIAEQGEPGRYVDRKDQFGYKRTYDLSKFQDAWVDTVASMFFPTVVGPIAVRRTSFLLYLHQVFAETMIAYRGIGQGSPKRPDGAMKSRAARAQDGRQPYEFPTFDEMGLVVWRGDVPELDDVEILRNRPQKSTTNAKIVDSA